MDSNVEIGALSLIAAWAVLGARTGGYSPIADPISRLAASGAPTQAAMTGAFAVYAAGVAAHAADLRPALSGATATTAALNAAATIGIAITPLDSRLGGVPHAAAAAATYASLAAIPLLSARVLARRGHRRAARASIATGLASGACLAISAVDTARTGLWRRTGLTVGHLWLMSSTVTVVRYGTRRLRGVGSPSRLRR